MVVHRSLSSPCKDCPDREVGCHSKCSKYKVFRIAQNGINKRELKEKAIATRIDSITRHAHSVEAWATSGRRGYAK